MTVAFYSQEDCVRTHGSKGKNYTTNKSPYLELLPIPRFSGITGLRSRIPLRQQRLELGRHLRSQAHTISQSRRGPDGKIKNTTWHMCACILSDFRRHFVFGSQVFVVSNCPFSLLRILCRRMASHSMVEAALKDHGGRKAGKFQRIVGDQWRRK